MVRAVFTALVLSVAAVAAAQTNLTGEWAISFTTPLGPSESTIYLTQEGPRLTGHLTSEYGEVPVRGSVNGDEVKLSWSVVDGGKTLDISVTATAKGNTMSGTARVGTAGEGPFTGERTDSPSQDAQPASSQPASSQTEAPKDVSGEWEITLQSPQGANTFRVTFKQDGETLTGLLKSRNGELAFRDGSITGSDLKFAFTINFQGTPIDIAVTGKVDDGPPISLAGRAQFGPFGEGDWTAKRPEAATAAATAASQPVAASTAASTGPTGKWDLTVKTQMGDVPATAELTESAGKVSGTFLGPTGLVDVAGTFDGNTLKLDFTAKTPQGDIPVSMTGDLNGDSIVNGKAEFGGMGNGEWSAKRKQ